MMHVAPAQFYHKVQREMDEYSNQGARVLFEGVKSRKPMRLDNNPQRRIRRFFDTLLSLYPPIAKGLGFETQKSKIVYPSDAINADITYREMVLALHQDGFVPPTLLMWVFAKKDFKRRLVKSFKEKGIAAFDRNPPVLARILFWLLFRKALGVLIHQRNEVAVSWIDQALSEGSTDKIYLLYGEGHVPGILKLLKRQGWKIHEVSYKTLN